MFARTPSALLELFVLLQQNPDIKGVRAATMRAVARSLWLIDEEFRQNPRHHRLFLEILRAPAGVTHELRRMNTYGVLGRYIPAFGRIVGRMQYDLFHAYTVDAHTLFVREQPAALRDHRATITSCRRPRASCSSCRSPRSPTWPRCSTTSPRAAGAITPSSARWMRRRSAWSRDCRRYDARLVAWLVRNHLQLSLTAQKQDIGDPEVINAFARAVGDEAHLDYLYVLTCADVRGTNPKLWNSWKASLFHDFYRARASRALRRGLETPIDQEELDTRDPGGRPPADRRTGTCPPPTSSAPGRASRRSYFLQHSPEEVAWHSRLLAERDPSSDEPLVALDPQQRTRHHRGAHLYAARAGTASRAPPRCSISWDSTSSMRASPRRATASRLDLYHVLEDDGAPITDRDRQEEIEHALWRSLQRPHDTPFAVYATGAAPGADVQYLHADRPQRR